MISQILRNSFYIPKSAHRSVGFFFRTRTSRVALLDFCFFGGVPVGNFKRYKLDFSFRKYELYIVLFYLFMRYFCICLCVQILWILWNFRNCSRYRIIQVNTVRGTLKNTDIFKTNSPPSHLTENYNCLICLMQKIA